MKRTLAVVAVVVGIVALCDASRAQPAAEQKQADVPVRAVVLFSSGVGYFEHFGTVQGDGSTELMFKSTQINDILKSLVLQDLDGGRVGTITYPSQDPIARTLKSFEVDLSGNPPLGELLNQLRGSQVVVTIAAEQVGGTILGVEKKQRPFGDKGNLAEVFVLNLLSDGTIKSINIDDVRGIALQDPELQAELNKALAALAQARDQDKKPVQIGFRGEGERRVRLGYVVETPIWKTSYRLVLDHPLPARPEGRGEGPDSPPLPPGEGRGEGAQDNQNAGHLQGWAIVENQTDNDWNNIQLSLVSGRPISFIQDLYQPLYIPRPIVQPELYASLRPQVYAEGMQEAKQADQFRAKAAHREQLGQAPMAAAPGARDRSVALEEDALGRAIDPTASVASVASAAKIGELFQYTVGSVSLPRQKSAMIPIITDLIEVEKLSIYNQTVLPRNPLNGARIKNTTDKHLLQGPITVFEANSYAGDARIDNTPPGTERLISYGIDLQMLVDATKNTSQNAIQTGRIVKGVLYITRKHQFSQDYLAENKSDHDKTLIVEHPIRQGWKLVDTEEPIETTESLYRFKGSVAAGKSSKLTVKEEIIQDETFAILPADIGQLEFYARQGEIPQKVRDALTKAAQLKSAMTDTQRQISDRDKRIASITQEQARIRDNLRAVERQSQYYNRLLTKLNEQESQIEKLQTEREDLHKKFEAQKKELEDYLMNLDVS